MGASSSVPGQPVLGAELRGEGSGCIHVPTGQMGQETAGPAWEAARKEAEAAVAGRGGGSFLGDRGARGRGHLPPLSVLWAWGRSEQRGYPGRARCLKHGPCSL